VELTFVSFKMDLYKIFRTVESVTVYLICLRGILTVSFTLIIRWCSQLGQPWCGTVMYLVQTITFVKFSCSYLGQRCISQYNPLLRHGMWKDSNRVFENVFNFKHLWNTPRLYYGRSAFTKKLTSDQVRRIRTAFPSEYFTISFCKI
jgi:hypothetical protein